MENSYARVDIRKTKESSNLETRIVNVNQTFQWYSVLISGLRATEK